MMKEFTKILAYVFILIVSISHNTVPNSSTESEFIVILVIFPIEKSVETSVESPVCFILYTARVIVIAIFLPFVCNVWNTCSVVPIVYCIVTAKGFYFLIGPCSG